MSTITNHHDHGDFEYDQAWVQDQVRKIQQYIADNKASLLAIDESSSPRILDYACGHGTISLALLDAYPSATFRGLDNHPKQVERYNSEAQNALGNSQSRMWAKVGDLYEGSSKELDSDEWFNFDTIIMSMALHHVADPLQMLVNLKKRLKSGGTLVLVEWLGAKAHDHGKHGHQHDHSGAHSHQHAPADMIDAPGGQKIWPGFDESFFREVLTEAGFQKASIDVRVPGVTFTIPEELMQSFHKGVNELVFVKGVV